MTWNLPASQSVTLAKSVTSTYNEKPYLKYMDMQSCTRVPSYTYITCMTTHPGIETGMSNRSIVSSYLEYPGSRLRHSLNMAR